MKVQKIAFFSKGVNFSGPKKQIFSNSKKSTFPKGLAHALGQKMPFSLYLDMVNIRLEIMVNYFEETQEIFSTIKNKICQSPKDRIFFKRAEPMLSALLDLIKITLEIMLSDFAKKKETFFDLKKQHFSKSKKSLFFRRG